MKNKFLIFFLYFLLTLNVSYAEQFRFETSEIEIIENGQLIYAKNGKAISVDGNLEIQAERFEFIKKIETLKAFKGTAFFKLDNLKIEFNEINLDQLNLITNAKDNVIITDLRKNISIQTNSVFFYKKKIF